MYFDGFERYAEHYSKSRPEDREPKHWLYWVLVILIGLAMMTLLAARYFNFSQ